MEEERGVKAHGIGPSDFQCKVFDLLQGYFLHIPPNPALLFQSSSKRGLEVAGNLTCQAPRIRRVRLADEEAAENPSKPGGIVQVREADINVIDTRNTPGRLLRRILRSHIT